MANNAIEESLLSRPDAAEPKGEDSISTLSSRVWVESRKIWRVTFPAMISYVCSFGVLVVTQAFIGRINETQLAAYAIIQTIGVRFANGIISKHIGLGIQDLPWVPLWSKGIWIGMLVGVAMQTLVLGIITYRTNWEEQVLEASERLNKLLRADSLVVAIVSEDET
ncbi:hypothetical protein SAY87_030638 [Trapa incisa]|uniref:Uncharacterized protein n=1 Tax=Trapa incisa TaxID=236973 RepID=A0AAN7KVK8_9MYRT|nr:hypothetical protein SAY87_030638 [Trapa incisa]